jgi:beta-lactamase regulating signal transducer with metallopeptidase domain
VPPLILLWLLGSGTFVLALVLEQVALMRLRARSTPVTDRRILLLAGQVAQAVGLRRGYRLHCSSACRVPMTWGVVRPIVMLPSESLRWHAGQVRAVLAP